MARRKSQTRLEEVKPKEEEIDYKPDYDQGSVSAMSEVSVCVCVCVCVCD